jgi:hypothetical protein
MKKVLISSLMIILLSGSLLAQGIYLRAGGGYGLPVATASLGQLNLRSDINNVNSNSIENVTGSYGSGTNFNFALGYKFNENFSFEISTQYLMSNKYKTGNVYTYTNTSYTYVDNYNTTTSAKALFFNPSFIFTAGSGKMKPYGRFGFVLGSPKVSGMQSIYYNGDGVESSQTKWEFSKGLSLGLLGAIGMNWKINEKFDFYTEINYTSMSYYAGEYNLTQDKNLLTGFDNLPNMTVSQKRTIYKNKFDPGAVNNDNTKPQVALKEATPFSSLSLQVGIRIPLWKKSE